MARVLEDIKKLFPKTKHFFQVYLIGTCYLLHKKLNRDDSSPPRKINIIYRLGSPHQSYIKDFTMSILQRPNYKTLTKNKSNGLLEFKFTKEARVEDFQLKHPENFVHSFDFQLADFSLDDLQTVKSDYTSDLDVQEFEKDYCRYCKIGDILQDNSSILYEKKSVSSYSGQSCSTQMVKSCIF